MVARHPRLRGLFGLGLAVLALSAAAARADENDPSSRVARLAYAEGSVSFEPAGTSDWVTPAINRPLTTGDTLWADRDARAELQLDGSVLRLGASTSVSFLNLRDHVTQIQLSAGTLLIGVRRFEDDETYEIDTPNLAFSLLRPGLYRLTVDDSGNTTVKVRRGQGEATGAGAAYAVYPNEVAYFSGTNPLQENVEPYDARGDALDGWSDERDARWEQSPSAQYVSPDVVGYADLDGQGTWVQAPGYGYVWYPTVEAGWAPYHEGHWVYVAPWGYTWVDDRPWGFAPFHYGRWVWSDRGWGWIPAPPPLAGGGAYIRPVYAPALVAWIGVGAGIAWFALGPREVYVPSYPVSRGYFNQLNVSNTTVNTTIINNVYNTTIVNNKTVNVINYVNRSAPGAVAATTSEAFTSGQPVARNRVAFDPREAASEPTRTLAPPLVPSKQAVLGPGRASASQPPRSVQARVVVAKTTPPPPPPTFEQRQRAIHDNAGKPLSVAQLRELSGTNPHPAVRLAPPAKVLVAPAPPSAAAPAPAHAAGPPNAPAGPGAPRPGGSAIHPSELPPPPQPASPSTANSVLERQHLQEQQELQARQNAERQRVQQQQEQEHAELAKQRAEAAQRANLEQQLERRHQQQTEEMTQRHTQEQQQLQQRQQQQVRQQPVQPRPSGNRENRPPNSPP